MNLWPKEKQVIVKGLINEKKSKLDLWKKKFSSQWKTLKIWA